MVSLSPDNSSHHRIWNWSQKKIILANSWDDDTMGCLQLPSRKLCRTKQPSVPRPASPNIRGKSFLVCIVFLPYIYAKLQLFRLLFWSVAILAIPLILIDSSIWDIHKLSIIDRGCSEIRVPCRLLQAIGRTRRSIFLKANLSGYRLTVPQGLAARVDSFYGMLELTFCSFMWYIARTICAVQIVHLMYRPEVLSDAILDAPTLS